MLYRRVPSWIELVVSQRFGLWAGGAEAVMVGMAGDSVGGFVDSLGIQLLKRSCILEMVFMMDDSGGIFDSAREEVDHMDNAVPCGDCCLGEVLVY